MRFARALAPVLLVAVLSQSSVEADVLARIVKKAPDDKGGGNAAADLTAWAGPARPTSLPELLGLAVRQAPSLQAARFDIAVAEARIEQTFGRNDWNLQAQLDVTHQRFLGNDTIDINPTTIGGSVSIGRALPSGGTIGVNARGSYDRGFQFVELEGMERTILTELHTGGVSVALTQPLMRGRGSFIFNANERKARLSRDASVLAKRLVAIQTVQAVVSAYWDLVLAERALAITTSSLDLAKERLRITQIGNDGGKVPRSEIPAVQQIIATREEDVLNGELTVLDRSIALRRAVGMPIGKGELGLRVGGELQTRDVGFEIGQLTESAFTASPELAQIKKQDQSALIDIEVTENGLLPQLDAALSAGPSAFGTSFGETWKSVGKFDAISITGTLTLQQSIGRDEVKGRAREQRELRRKLQVTEFDIRAQIAQTMARAVAQLEVAKRRVALTQRAIDLANENIKIESDRFNLGKATNFDVLNRQEELRQAELRKAQAIIDWHKGEAVVQALTGDILPTYGITVD
ncbi:MAG TPA: TolC family protein [Kofleriaceae bacterium]